MKKLAKRTRAGRVAMVCVTVGTSAGCPFNVDPPAQESGDEGAPSGGTTMAATPGEMDSESAPGYTEPTSSPESDETAETVTDATGAPTSPGATEGVDDSACVALGGEDKVAAIVGEFQTILNADDRINVYFLNQGFIPVKFASCLTDYLAVALACEGAVYDCEDMQSAHAGMGVSAVDLGDFREDFVAAVDVFALKQRVEVAEPVRDALLGAVDAAGAELVEDPVNNSNVYQRIGRNPALRTFATDLNARMAAHPALGAFWTDVAAPEQTNVCYSRIIGDDAAIGGPMVYGEELAPLLECEDISDVHAAKVKDSFDQSAITLDDFMIFLGEVAAQVDLSFPDATPADRAALGKVFADRCEDVVKPANDCESAHNDEDVVIGDEEGWFIPAYDPMMDPPKQICQIFTVAPSDLDYVGYVQIDDFSLTHTWAGDLVITLTNPEQDTLLYLLRRPGTPMVMMGYGAIFDAGAPISFRDGGDVMAETLGQFYAPGDVVCQTHQDCEISPPQNVMAPAMTFSAFVGTKATGDWTLCIEDHVVDSHSGYLYGATLHLTKVKYPF